MQLCMLHCGSFTFCGTNAMSLKGPRGERGADGFPGKPGTKVQQLNHTGRDGGHVQPM